MFGGMARSDPQTNIRLPADLKQRLTDAAKEANRTFGAEVVKRLEESFEVDRLIPEGLEAHEAKLVQQAASLARVDEKLDRLSAYILAGVPLKKKRPEK